MMKDVKFPGVLWVVIIVAAVLLSLRFFDKEIVSLIFIPLAFGVLKSLKLGTEDENLAIDIIEGIKSNPRIQDLASKIGFKTTAAPAVQMRGPHGVGGRVVADPEESPLILPATPPRPNKTMRWLLG